MGHFYLKIFFCIIAAVVILCITARRRKNRKLPPQVLSLPAKEVQTLADCPDLKSCAELISRKYGKSYSGKKYLLPELSVLRELLESAGVISGNTARLAEVAAMLEENDFTVYELRPESLSEEHPLLAAIYRSKETQGWCLELYTPDEKIFSTLPEKFTSFRTAAPSEPSSSVQ